MQEITKSVFYDYARNAPLGGRLTQDQVDGFECIFAACAAAGLSDIRKIAYILATAFHETGGLMQPVREGFAKTDKGARKIIAARPYGKPSVITGHVYYGRGHVQLTWSENYRKMGEILGLDLHANPDLALDPQISARILVEGMTKGKSGRGDFTGKSLDDYFNLKIEDPVNARKIVNGADKQHLIAGYYKNFLDALKHAQIDDGQDSGARPDRPALATDQTLIGGATAMASTGALGFLSQINSPWAFAAFALAAIIAAGAVYLFFTGRIKIARKAGA